MKKYIITFGLIVNSVLYAQNPEIKTDLPTIIPPSPTVAALMKFEEIPVNNYTGVPDISVPLINIPTLSNDINLDISLKYHANSTKLDEIASDIGLGWSLSCGATISRTVRGLPDESIKVNKYGLYRNNPANNLNYYQFLQDVQNLSTFNPLSAINVVNDLTNSNIKQFLWELNAKNLYDVQHDLWQFNFNGHTGRFIIEKQSNGNLEVKLLSNSNLKIINNYTLPSSTTNHYLHYKPIGFTVYDEKGYRYLFDIIEVTNNTQFTETTSQNGIMQSSHVIETFNSAFHLSKIYDNNNEIIVEYSYLDGGMEYNTSSSATHHYPQDNADISGDMDLVIDTHGRSYGTSFILSLYKPLMSISSNSNGYEAKKVSEIKVKNKGKINFNYNTGRLDENYTNASNSKTLKEIVVKNINDIEISKYILHQEYKYATSLKLFLKKITQKKENDSIELFKFDYKGENDWTNNYKEKDAWGYLTQNSNCFDKYIDIDLVSSFTLQKMTLPTGGCKVFEYESNTYSHEGNQPITNFDENFENWNYFNRSFSCNEFSCSNIGGFTIQKETDLCITGSGSGSLWFISLYYKPMGSTDDYVMIGGVNSESACLEFNMCRIENLQPGKYYFSYSGTDYPVTGDEPVGGSVGITYRQRKTTDYKQYLYGGGFRIASVSDYDSNINLINNISLPKRKKIYNYEPFNSNNNYTSGALVSKKPLYRSTTSKVRPALGSSYQSGHSVVTIERNWSYDVFSNNDMINRNKTQGADVGYDNVTVYEINNGKTEFTYTNSTIYPNINYTLESLHLPSIDMDYKRGLLKKVETFDNTNKRLNSIKNDYIFEDYTKITGLHVFGTYDQGYNDCPSFSLFTNYNHYLSIKNSNCTPFAVPCGVGNFASTFNPNLNIGFTSITEAYGWSKLTSKTTKNYFYPNGGNTPEIVESKETFTYNPLNKQIASHTVDNSVGDILTTNYFYHTGNSPFSQNRISEIERIETKRGTNLLSESKINYSNAFAGNQSYLPQYVEVKKGSSPSEVRLRNNAYDEFGHVLEVQQESGIKISYIYGYNKTQPVAKLENIAYSAIPNTLITAIQTATNDTAGTEGQVIDALNALRTSTDVNLKNAMITTITYKPLIGISTVTDPKGDKITYHYDSFNRLEFVKDKNENILSENKYHYKN